MSNTLNDALMACKKGFYLAGLFSALINLLMLTVPIYMLQLFDRVLIGQSSDTLIYLTIIAIIALLTMALLDIVRGRLLGRISHWLETKISLPALSKSADVTLAGSTYSTQCLKDIDQIRLFLSSTSIHALFDIPWTPIYILVVFLLYSLLGVITVIGALILTVIALLHIRISNKTTEEANKTSIKNRQYIESSLQHAEVIEAMGMLPGVTQKWYKRNNFILDHQEKSMKRTGVLFSLSKFIRLVLQIVILGTGAYLVIQGTITPGAMIASSIIVGRALTPIEQAIGSWRQAIMARDAYKRLKIYFDLPQERLDSIELPSVNGKLSIEKLFFISKSNQQVILQGIQFEAVPGEVIAVVGHSGAGKSTLGRLILGIWLPTRGRVRLDGADVYHWDRVNFGKHVGYLPQSTGLFVGSIKENICRMGEINDEKMMAAARYIGAHDMILHLSEGYDTQVDGYNLSGGQQRRVALARAFYDDPSIIVLDEPETNLDKESSKLLIESIQKAKKDNKTIILISQSNELVKFADKLLVLDKGKMKSFGPNTVAQE